MLFGSVAMAATLSVSPCDGQGDGSESSPYCSINRALNAAQPGDVVSLADGRYDEQVLWAVSGEPGAPIVLEGSRQAVLVGDSMKRNWNEALEVTLDAVVQIQGASHIELRGFSIEDSKQFALHASAVTAVVVDGLRVHNTRHGGLIFDDGSERVVVRRNEVSWTNIRHWVAVHEAISLSDVHDFVVEENCVSDVREEGIDIKDGSSDGVVRYNYVRAAKAVGLYLNLTERVEVHHNTVLRSEGTGFLMATGDLASGEGTLDNDVHHNVFVFNGQNGIELWRGPGSEDQEIRDNRIHHNTVFGNAHCGVRAQDGSDNTFADNLYGENGLGTYCGNAVDAQTYVTEGSDDGMTEIMVSAPFVDPAEGDFRLLDDSMAVDAGSEPREDADGPSDLGAYELGASDLHWSVPACASVFDPPPDRPKGCACDTNPVRWLSGWSRRR